MGLLMRMIIMDDNNGDNNIKKKGKLKTIVLSPNVNDYDTGEDNLT